MIRLGLGLESTFGKPITVGHYGGVLFSGCFSPPGVYPSPIEPGPRFCLPSLSSHFLPSCLLHTSRGLSWLSVSSWWKLPSSHYCLACAKRPAHKRPARGPNFHFPHAAQRDSIEASGAVIGKQTPVLLSFALSVVLILSGRVVAI